MSFLPVKSSTDFALANRTENSTVILTISHNAEVEAKIEKSELFAITYPHPRKHQTRITRISFCIHESLWIIAKSLIFYIKKFFNFGFLDKNQKSFFSLEGRMTFGWSIARPSISQRNSCLVKSLASEALRGHWKRPFSSRRFW